MTSPYLLADLARDEGLRLNAYPDPLSPRGRCEVMPSGERPPNWQTLPAEPWTYGYGSTTRPDGSLVQEGDTCTLEEASALLKAAAAKAEAELDRQIPWWRELSSYRQDVFTMLAYNMGWPRLSGFHHMLEAAHAGDFERAANELLASKWEHQVGARAQRLARQLRTGVRAV
jgi:lysozyme